MILVRLLLRFNIFALIVVLPPNASIVISDAIEVSVNCDSAVIFTVALSCIDVPFCDKTIIFPAARANSLSTITSNSPELIRPVDISTVLMLFAVKLPTLNILFSPKFSALLTLIGKLPKGFGLPILSVNNSAVVIISALSEPVDILIVDKLLNNPLPALIIPDDI